MRFVIADKPHCVPFGVGPHEFAHIKTDADPQTIKYTEKGREQGNG